MSYLIKWLTAYIRSILGIIISLLLLGYTLHSSGLEWSQIQFNTSSIVNWVLAVFVFIFTIILHALRTKFIWVNNTSELKTIRSYGSLIIGNFYNSVLPGNLGEGVRAWHFHKKNQVTLSCSLAAIVTEKFIDAQVFLTLTLPLLWLLRERWESPLFFTLAMVSFAVVLANGVLAVLWQFPGVAKRLLSLLPKRELRFSLWRLFIYFKCHVRHLLNTKFFYGYLIGAFVLIFFTQIQYFFVLKAVNVAHPLVCPFTLYLLGCIMMVASSIPSAPSSAGVVHYGIYASLLLAAAFIHLPITPAMKQNFAIVSVYLHLSYFIPEILLGLFYLWKERKLLFEQR